MCQNVLNGLRFIVGLKESKGRKSYDAFGRKVAVRGDCLVNIHQRKALQLRGGVEDPEQLILHHEHSDTLIVEV